MTPSRLVLTGPAATRHFGLQETPCVLGAVVQTGRPDVYPGVSGVACRMARMAAGLVSFPWWTIDV